MGRNTFFVAVALFLTALVMVVHASDPELTTDFFVPPNETLASINATFFTNTLLRKVTPDAGVFATVTPVNVGKFQALTGLGVSSALLQFPPGTVNPVHIHPRGTELLFIIEGTLSVGLLDTSSPVPKFFTQILKPGDLFVFPRGLVHFQINCDRNTTVKAVAAFSSSNPGLVKLPVTIFGTGISVEVLRKSFGVSPNVIGKLIEAQVRLR